MIKVSHISKIYKPSLPANAEKNDSVETKALNDVSLEIKKGEFVAIIGPSGSGKSTLMHIIGALDTPTMGKYSLDGEMVEKMTEDELADIRNRKIGFVFQAYNLLPRTTALKNVMLPMVYAGYSKTKRIEMAKKLLTLVGLSDRMEHTSSQLSGGQMQRVAIARALALDPAMILADEPTGNLASQQAEEIMDILTKLNKQGHTIILVTHEPSIAKRAKRTITLKDGKIVKDLQNGHLWTFNQCFWSSVS